jgi:hypothetical protein
MKSQCQLSPQCRRTSGQAGVADDVDVPVGVFFEFRTNGLQGIS